MKHKVLISCPTAEIKDYAFGKWIENVRSLSYSNYDIHLVDNSEDSNYFKRLRKENQDITIERVNPNHFESFKHALAASHERCRLKAIKGGYDYLLHLESDVIPPIDVIERLIMHHKPIVGAMYHVEEGAESKLMIQKIENSGVDHRETQNLDQTDLSFVDGELKPVFSCGLGCVLISRPLLNKVPFRFEGDGSVHPDSIYYGDLNREEITVYVDTSVLCEHDNKSMIRV